ncbi:hypothetical protein RF11_10321 [Thelohanellus kitauei]|uniref:Uncharacterized protein n=1 Tax=Thelohanellus kitauei TaxID=669202 RepID=A0A0C2N3Y6_THEKT|nr:hypothetical protein RF11_10321 [Thelohanellus kitauei]
MDEGSQTVTEGVSCTHLYIHPAAEFCLIASLALALLDALRELRPAVFQKADLGNLCLSAWFGYLPPGNDLDGPLSNPCRNTQLELNYVLKRCHKPMKRQPFITGSAGKGNYANIYLTGPDTWRATRGKIEAETPLRWSSVYMIPEEGNAASGSRPAKACFRHRQNLQSYVKVVRLELREPNRPEPTDQQEFSSLDVGKNGSAKLYKSGTEIT